MEFRTYDAGSYDVVVIGAGHAGIEAALAAARLGKKTLIMTISMEAIADMPCNPNVGGTGKGHLVREIDALGGEMALNIDKTFIQSRMLNTSKGPAIHSLRVQADKVAYHREMKKVIENQKNLYLIETEAKELLVDDGVCKGVITLSGAKYTAKTVIVATGTYLNGLIMMGELQYTSGPHGLKPSLELSKSLLAHDFELRRFKTGTPARVHRRSIDTSVMEEQHGDAEVIPFSFLNIGKDLNIEQELCYLTYTTPRTHEIINENLHRSPMYAGLVEGIGPRYCPSIEDKVVRFSDKDSHQVFLEPEGLETQEMYVQGVSSTLPEEVQLELYRTIIGLEDVEIMRSAYGIEYDSIDSTMLKLTLESKQVENLYFAGQINGTSGYEEAAAQGLVAGINAVLKIDKKEPFILDRSQAYIGVLIDDLITKGTNEPYRMMTSRAEYRLALRQDNADLRLTQKGYDLGLVSKERYDLMMDKKKTIEIELERLKSISINPKAENNDKLQTLNSSALKTGVTLYDLIKRPELSYDNVAIFDPDRPEIPRQYCLELETQIKYEGYIAKQEMQIAQFKKLENKSLDEIDDYKHVKGLKLEAIQKLNNQKPISVGQASRISGVSPADINVILIHLETLRRKKNEETL